MKPFIKWPGGKSRELKIIEKYLPTEMERFFEPFVGGGAVYLSINNAISYHINDKSRELIGLYKHIQTQNPVFFDYLNKINKYWHLIEDFTDVHLDDIVNLYLSYKKDLLTDFDLKDNILTFVKNNEAELNGMLSKKFTINEERFLHEIQKNLSDKLIRTKSLEAKRGALSLDDLRMNIETGFKNGLYKHLRYLYNNGAKLGVSDEYGTAIFYFIREYCYSSMFRYNSKGKFNVPYGGSSYNKKYLDRKIQSLQNENLNNRLSKTSIDSLDFEEFLQQYTFTKNDFIFLDPPYDTTFSTYANNAFSTDDQIRLSEFCETTNAKFMLVIKNTDFIYGLYKSFNVVSFDKKYTVSFQNRNDKKAEHILVTNY